MNDIETDLIEYLEDSWDSDMAATPATFKRSADDVTNNVNALIVYQGIDQKLFENAVLRRWRRQILIYLSHPTRRTGIHYLLHLLIDPVLHYTREQFNTVANGTSIRAVATLIGPWNAWTEAAGCSFTRHVDGDGRSWARYVEPDGVTITPILTFGTSKTWAATTDWGEFTFKWGTPDDGGDDYPRFDYRRGATAIIVIYMTATSIRVLNNTISTDAFTGLTQGDEWTIRVVYVTDSTFKLQLSVNGGAYTDSTTFTTASARLFSDGAISTFYCVGATTRNFDSYITDLRASWITSRLLPHNASRDVRYLRPHQQHHESVITIDYEENERA